jgi:hypothetical protein
MQGKVSVDAVETTKFYSEKTVVCQDGFKFLVVMGSNRIAMVQMSDAEGNPMTCGGNP